MTLNSDSRFKEKLTCGFKYDMRNLVNFHPTTQKSKTFTLMGCFCPKHMRFKLKQKRGVISHGNEQWCKIWETLTLWFQKWHEEFGELSSLEHSKVWKLYIDGLFLSKAYTVSSRKFQRNFLPWKVKGEGWRVPLKGVAKFKQKFDVWLEKGIWLSFMSAVESPKICTLIWSVCPKHTNI